MNISRILFQLKMFNEEIELISILIFLLFYPGKTTFLYFLIFGLLITAFLIRNLITSKNIGVSSFTLFLLSFNCIILITSAFSVSILNSLLFFFDIFLISFYYLFRFNEPSGDKKSITNIAYLIALFSLFQSILFIASGNKTFFFNNPILSGIVSGMAVLIFLYNLINHFTIFEFSFLAISIISLYISSSKAAFIGVASLALIMILARKKKLIAIFLTILVFTIAIPNPIRNMFIHSISKDPYSKNRIDIWKLSVKMFKAFPLTGVGPDNFSEVSQQFNFRQTNGPANYFKVPRAPHNDYLKIISENGIPGLIIIILFLIFITRRILSGSLYNIYKILILYILFQAFFFDFIFKTFFFFLFLYLVRGIFPNNKNYISNSPFLKTSILFLLIVTIFIGYILPYNSEKNLLKVKNSKDPSSVLRILDKCKKFNPLDPRIYYVKGLVFYKLFRIDSSSESFSRSLFYLRKSLDMNRYFLDSYLLESDLFLSVMKRGVFYPGLKDEILSPLKKYETLNPFNPFVILEEANIHMKFREFEEAKRCAVKALKIEPEFISAIYFLHKNFNYYGSVSSFRNRVNKIKKKSCKMGTIKVKYLNSLFKVPDEMKRADFIK